VVRALERATVPNHARAILRRRHALTAEHKSLGMLLLHLFSAG
jgi:hypothetical protein